MLYEKIFRKFNSSKVRYLIIGGIAVNLHGYYRATGDLDILLSLDDKNVTKFIEAVKSLNLKPKVPVKIEEFADKSKRDFWQKEKNMLVFSLVNPKDPMETVDVMIANPINFEKAFKDRIKVNAGEISLPVISIDDLIKLKQLAKRDRDIMDIKALKNIRKMKDED
jgi:hypothetical protein